MGIKTLEGFRVDLVDNLDGTISGNERLNSLINFAYFELIGGTEFEEFLRSSPFFIERGEDRTPLPPRLLGIRGITFHGQQPPREMGTEILFSQGERVGIPLNWALLGEEIVFWPRPIQALEGNILYIEEPLPLLEDDERTALPGTWDLAIVLLATHYGFLGKGFEEKASFWGNRALTYIRSRLSREDRSFDPRSMGVTPVREAP